MKSEYSLYVSILEQFPAKENGLVVQIMYIAMKKEQTVQSIQTPTKQGGCGTDHAFMETAGRTLLAAMTVGLSAIDGEPQCVCNRIRTT